MPKKVPNLFRTEADGIDRLIYVTPKLVIAFDADDDSVSYGEASRRKDDKEIPETVEEAEDLLEEYSSGGWSISGSDADGLLAGIEFGGFEFQPTSTALVSYLAEMIDETYPGDVLISDI